MIGATDLYVTAVLSREEGNERERRKIQKRIFWKIIKVLHQFRDWRWNRYSWHGCLILVILLVTMTLTMRLRSLLARIGYNIQNYVRWWSNQEPTLSWQFHAWCSEKDTLIIHVLPIQRTFFLLHWQILIQEIEERCYKQNLQQELKGSPCCSSSWQNFRKAVQHEYQKVLETWH